MAVKADTRMVKGKKDKNKLVKKITYKCEGSYVDMDGNPHRYHKRGFISSDEAKDWERTFLLINKSVVDNSITFDDLFKLYKASIAETVKATSFYDIDKLYQKHLKPYWKDKIVSSIDMNTIDNFKMSLLQKTKKSEETYSNKTLNKIQTRLKTILKFGSQKGYIKDYRITSFSNIQRANELKKEMLFWHPSEYDKFIKIVDEPIYIAFFNVLYWCGLRIGETLALTWNDIDFEKKTINIDKSYTKHKRQTTTPKTQNSYRSVIMTSKCYESLKVLHETQERIIGFDTCKLLFYFNKPLDDNSIRIKKDNWIKQANVKRIRIHDFRHSHVSLLISLGFNPFDIAKRLGHSVEMVNNIYAHWFNNAQLNMVEKLNNL